MISRRAALTSLTGSVAYVGACRASPASAAEQPDPAQPDACAIARAYVARLISRATSRKASDSLILEVITMGTNSTSLEQDLVALIAAARLDPTDRVGIAELSRP
jgi:hypothetical protein